MKRWLLLPCAFAFACGDDGVTGPMQDATGGGSSTGDATTQDPGPDPDTAVADVTSSAGDESSTGAAVVPLELARGIRLPRLVANQGVQIELVGDGIEIPGDAHTATLVGGRRTLVRGFWSLHAEFEPRELIGRLTVDYPDGRQLVQDYPIFVEGESSDAGKSFQWLLEADDVVDGMLFRARVLEPDPALAAGELSDPPPIAPLAGRGTLAVHDVPLEIRVVLVPVLHKLTTDDGLCEQAPEITDDDVEDMRRELEQNNPVQTALFTVREPMLYTDPIGTSGRGFVDVLTALAMTRELDDPGPNVYYYGLLAPCDGYPPGLLGQAIGIPSAPLVELQHQRVATGRWNGSGAAAAETFVHEIGHTQGRRHVRCSGGEAGVDPNYPHLNGRIGVWGFGIHDFKLRTPTGARDYMTYCSNEWVSDYGWEQTLTVIETLTSWDTQGAVDPEMGAVLVGALYTDDPAHAGVFWTARGGVPDDVLTAGARVRFVDREGVVEERGAWVYERPHGGAIQIVAPLSSRWDDAIAIAIDVPGRERIEVGRADVRVLHR